MPSIQAINNMTLSEYEFKMLAFNLSKVDELAMTAQQVWWGHLVSGVDKNGESPFKELKDLFDYEKAVDQVYKPEPKESEMNPELVRIAKRMQTYHAQKGDE